MNKDRAHTFLALAFSLLACRVTFSQVAASRQIGIGTGLSINTLRSELISPLAHQGSTSPIQFFFRSGGDISRHHVQWQYSNFKLRSSFGGLKTKEERGNLQYAFHRRFLKPRKNMMLFAGLVVSGTFSLRNNLINGNTVGNNETGDLNFSLSPSVLFEWSVGKSYFQAQGWTSVLSYSELPGYALANSETQWGSVANYVELNSRLSYLQYISTRWGIQTDYQFFFVRQSKNETLNYQTDQWMFSLVYKIKVKRSNID